MEAALLDPKSISDHLKALALWDRDANVPDVIGRADLRGQPFLVAEILQHRLQERVGPVAPLVGSYPKDDGYTRATCLLDPYDDIRYSILVSRVAASVEGTLPSNRVVQSTRFLPVGGAFGAEGWREAFRRRRQVVARDDVRSGGFDVRNHFGTIDLMVIERVLQSCGTSDGQCRDLIEFLSALGAWPASPAGLLSGPMASALIGTAALLPIDRLFKRQGVVYERWMDDIVVRADTSTHFNAIRDAVEGLLGQNGQTLNSEKDWYGSLSQSGASSLAGESAIGERERWAVDEQALAEAVERRDASACRSILGMFRADQDGSAAAFVVESDPTWDLGPGYAADYLLSLNSPLTGAQVERLAQRCIDRTAEQPTAVTAHCARVLGRRRVSPKVGEALFGAAEQAAVGRNRLAAPYLFYASARSTAKAKVRLERSLDTAGVLADLHCGRALIAGLSADTLPPNAAAGLRSLARARHELGPAVALVS